MKKNLLLWGTAIVLVLTAIYVTKYYNKDSNSSNTQNASYKSAQGQAVSASSDSAGQKAIDFTLTDLDGKKVSLSDFKGKNVYINFWATWCPWCVKELPDIEKVYNEYKDKDLVILAVDLGESKDTVKSFINRNNYHFKALLDSGESVAQAYNVNSIPVSIFIDKNGNITVKRVGALSAEEMQAYVKQLTGK